MFKKYFKTLIRNLLDKISGRKIFQSFFERLYEISLKGMNFGGVDIKISGERKILKNLAQNINKDVVPVVFDVGANVGEYSLEVISVFGKKVRLYCFEPSKKSFISLMQNFRDYENVKVYNLGFGEKDKTTTLYSDQIGSGSASLFDRRLDHSGREMKYKEQIKIKQLDDFCREKAINHIHLLKLDVEGNEFNVLKGARQLIDSDSIDFIQFEFGGCNIDSKTFFQDFFYLLNPNYRIHRVLKNGLVPIDNYKEKYEVFIGTNYLAISRKLMDRSEIFK